MSDLIRALQIFLKYGDPYSPTACEHDVLYVCISPTVVSDVDQRALKDCGFFADTGIDGFKSYRYGSY